jgi:SAM-dependent methyltransferase
LEGAERADRAREGVGLTEAAALWSGASYERIAATFAPIHDRVVAAIGPRPNERVLDLACGTGGVALRAARTGADVVGLDFSPDQLEKARAAADAEGLSIRFDEGDAQALPYGDREFDAVISVFGVVFAHDHMRAAAELERVCRGRIAITAWPHDAWAEVGERVGRYSGEGDDARLWTQPDYVRNLLRDTFDLRFETGEYLVEGTPEELWEFFSTSAPPIKAWLEGVGEREREEGRRAYLDLFAPGYLRREYTLILGTRR